MSTVAPWRLNLMRVVYGLMFFGQGSIQLPMLANHPSTWPFWHGVGSSMLGGMALVAGIGLRYPLRMLPLLVFELAWKAIWMLCIALPLWRSGQMDPDTADTVKEVAWGVIVPLVIPWSYFWENYVRAPAEPWRRAAARAVANA